jgi:hypothetical protein
MESQSRRRRRTEQAGNPFRFRLSVRAVICLGFVALPAIPALPSRLAAQTAALIGTVVRDTLGTPVSDALVQIPQIGREARTDALGQFRLAPIRVGTVRVLIRVPGYAPVSDSVTIADTDLHRTFVLDRLPQMLDTVLKIAERPLTAGMRHLERRRASGMGRFLLPEQLRQMENRSLPSVLSGFSGTTTMHYRGSAFLASSRGNEGIGRQLPRAIRNDSRSPRGCWTQVFLDGVRLYGLHEGSDVPDLRLWDVRQLEAVEYYRGPAETPSELSGLGAICGTLALWTRQK